MIVNLGEDTKNSWGDGGEQRCQRWFRWWWIHLHVNNAILNVVCLV